MSFKALVVPEDPTLNGHILKPLAEALLGDAGKPNAKVRVLDNPRIRGYAHAVRAIRSDDLHASYAFYDLWLFFPDADRAKPDAMEDLEANGCGSFASVVPRELWVLRPAWRGLLDPSKAG